MNKIYYNITSVITGAVIFASFMLFSPAITFADEGYDLDEFDDLELQSLDKHNKKSSNSDDNKKLILFDDNLYFLDDDFDFGEEELELQKLELNPGDMETAKEYEDFLNAFFENSTPVGVSPSKKSKLSNKKTSKKSKAKRDITKKSPMKTHKRSKDTSLPIQSYSPSRGALGYGISTMLGATIPIGTNLKSSFSSGTNFGIHLATPLSFNVGSMEGMVGTEVYFSSMSAVNSGGSPYKLINLAGTISLFPLKSIEVKAGLGLSPSSIGDYSKVLFSIPVDINFYLPFNVKGFGMALNLHAQETLGIPNDLGTEDTKATSEFINVGFFITTPLVF